MTNAVIRIWIPGPPVPKGRPRMTRHGHTYTPPRTAQYEETVAFYGLKGMQGHPPLTGAVSLVFQAIFPIPKSWSATRQQKAVMSPHIGRPDGDNVIKSVTDGLNGIAWVDDSQIAEIRFRKVYGKDPGVLLEVSPMAG